MSALPECLRDLHKRHCLCNLRRQHWTALFKDWFNLPVSKRVLQQSADFKRVHYLPLSLLYLFKCN
jgi:hypothetical protein